MRLLRKTTLADDGFTTDRHDTIKNAEFQQLHRKVYEGFTPGINAQNKLARATRWGVLAHDRYIWMNRNTYSLPADKNKEEAGRVRQFGLIPEDYLRRPEVEDILSRTFLAWEFQESTWDRAYEVQLSAIRYEPTIAAAAMPSPVVPHQDLVDGAIVVMAKTDHLLGGVSRLYTVEESPLYEVDLDVGEALLIQDAKLKHQVTPIMLAPDMRWRPGERVFRDILIVRYQPLGR